MFSLKDKVAIVTGSNKGIGKGIAMAFAKFGAHVVVVGRNENLNIAVSEEIKSLGVRSLPVKLDVTDEKSVKNFFSTVMLEFGKIDILVNNAGTNIRKSPELYSLEEWNFIMNTNLTSAFLCSKEAFMHMKNNKNGGKIINIGSMLSIFGGEYAAVYAASKGGIVQLTKSLAAAWASYEIQVNAILPGWITTDLTAGMREKFPDLVEAIDKRILSKRWGNPEDLAGTAVFLASSASDYINGIVLPVDGGYSISIK
tara:strand:- start:3028 stop:3792 length:765 start_codon:yes stop_codon:yes gene_type:complete